MLENWLKIAAGKRTVIFCINKAHGAALLERFMQAGTPAEMLTDDDSDATREAVMTRLESGETQVVINCFLLSYGVDIPAVECIVLARPTRSLVLYLQSVCRGLRAAPGKDACIVVDHGRVVEKLGLPTDDFAWSLSEDSNVNDRARERAEKRHWSETEQTRTCPECHYCWKVSEEGSVCRNCGWQPRPIPKDIPTIGAELTERGVGAEREIDASDPAVVQFYIEAIAYKAARKPQQWSETPNKTRWAAWMSTRERFRLARLKPPGNFWGMQPAAAVSETVRGWLKSRDIRWARSQQRARG